MGKSAILLGATGLIGADLLKKLLSDSTFDKVLVITRKEIKLSSTKLKQLIVDFDDIAKHKAEITGDIVFCCLGTTAKKTPDKKLYKKIDYQYPLDVAKIAYEDGASEYHLISAMGADANSSIFYNRIKGEVEKDLKLVGFESLFIYRPSLLDGDRKESRLMEGIMIGLMRIINPILVGGLKKYRSIKIEKVASAMLKQSKTDSKGIYIYPSDEIEKLGS